MSSLTEHIANVNHLYSQNTSMTDIKEALAYISPDICRDEWVQVGMALKSDLGDDGYAVFDTWSQGSDKYNASDCKSTWRSINSTGGIRIATLLMMAKKGGHKQRTKGMHKPFNAPLSASKPLPIEEPKSLTKSCEIAQKFWDESVPGKSHPYADKKRLSTHGLRVHGDQLCVPAYNENKQIQSIQRISHDGKKKNLANTKIKDCFHFIGGDTSTIVICEGWATAKSVNAATNYASVVSFGCAGLMKIAILFRDKAPDSLIIIAADTDHVKEAQTAAMAVSGLVAVPLLESGTDFNDLHLSEGLESVEYQFQECIVVGFVSYGGSSGENENDWPEPEPLPTELYPVPEFDFNLLPESIRDWVADIADRQGCPPEFPAVTALVHMGATIGRKIGVRPKRNGDQWTVVPNLWGAVVGPPSLMKSPAIREARLPFKKVENRLLEDTEEEQVALREEFTSMKLEFDAEEVAVKHGWKDLKSGKSTKNGKLPDRAELNERSADLSNTKTLLDELERKAFALRRIEVNDPTPEALQVVLSNNPNGVLYFNDELTSWLETLEKSGREGSRQMHLEMADGTDTGTVDRIGRGHVEYNKIESIFGSIQPGPLGSMVEKALSPNKSNDGLIQRIQLTVYRNSFKGKPKDAKPDHAAAQRAENAFMRLYEITLEDVGCHDADIPYLHLSPEAYAIWWAWYVDLQVTASRYSEALTSHLMKYPSLVISLALIDHLSSGGSGEIGADSMHRAFGLMDWLWEHAQRVYSATGYAERARLRALAERIQQRRLGEEFTLRDLKRRDWSGIVKSDITDLLNELVSMNWLSHQVVTGPNGGRPSEVYTVNPRVFQISDKRNPPTKPTKPINEEGYVSFDGKKPQGENVELDKQTNSSPRNTDPQSCVEDKELF